MDRTLGGMEEDRSAFKILASKHTGKSPLVGVVGSTILEWILKKLVSIREIGLTRLRDKDYWRTLVNVALNL